MSRLTHLIATLATLALASCAAFASMGEGAGGPHETVHCDPDTHRSWCRDAHTVVSCGRADGGWFEWDKTCGHTFGDAVYCRDSGAGASCGP